MDDANRIIKRLRERFPNITNPPKDDICYATQNRQDAVKTVASKCDLVLVVGSPNSSNSNRWGELAERSGAEAYLIDSEADIRAEWLQGKVSVGVTAGASAPEVLVNEVIDAFRARFKVTVEPVETAVENVEFKVPRVLREPA